MSTIALSCSLGQLAVSGGYVRMGVRGNWTGHVECASVTKPAGACALLVQPEQTPGAPPASPATFQGWVRDTGSIEGSNTLTVEIVGGAGQLGLQLPPLDYSGGLTGIPAGAILSAIIGKLPGEQLAAGVVQALDAYLIPRWHTVGGTIARDAIDLLVYDLAQSTGLPFGWRMMGNGQLWAGLETYPVVNVADSGSAYTGQDTRDGVVLYAPNGAPLAPGTTITSSGPAGSLAVQAVEVLYTLSSPALRARVRRAMAGDPPKVPDLSLYSRTWPASVKTANADGSIDVTCDDARLGDLRGLTFRPGLPGCTAAPPALSRVRVAFDGASPRGAYACTADPGGTPTDPAPQAFALVTAGTYLSATAPPGGGPVVFVLSPTPTGAPGEVQIVASHKYAKGVHG